MAKCTICKTNLGFGGGTSVKYADYLAPLILCDDCKQLCDQADKGNDDAIGILKAMPSVNSAICEYFEEKVSWGPDRKVKLERQAEVQRQELAKRAQTAAQAKEIIMTTGNNLEGYRIVKYLGLVFGDTVFKQSFSDAVTAGLSDLFTSFSFSAQEMTGAVSLIEKGREFAIEKIRYSAAGKGANAIISVDFEDTFGKDVIHVSVNGTAVIVEPINPQSASALDI